MNRVNTLKVRSHAKINLSLDVVSKRSDGYHEVETVMQRLNLFDEITITFEENERCDNNLIEIHTNRSYLPTDEKNLAYKAAKILWDYANAHQHDISGRLNIDIYKRIPVSAGLAGGSGNAAATLIGLNRIWNLGLKTKELCNLGKALGADVAFLILAENTKYRTALGKGVGDELSTIKSRFNKHILLVKPSFGVSTKEVYAGIDKCKITERPNTAELVEALKVNNQNIIYSNIINVLENYTLKEYQEVSKLRKIVQETDNVEKVIMSGSGPTIVGFYGERYFAKAACERMRDLGYEAYWTEISK